MSYACCCAVLSRSGVSNSVTPWTVALQAPLSMGILQARILESVAMPSSRGSSQPRDRIQFSRNAGGFFIIWTASRRGGEGRGLIFSCENPKSQLTAGQPSTGECWSPPKADTPCPKDDAVKLLHSTCQHIWKTQQWPQD